MIDTGDLIILDLSAVGTIILMITHGYRPSGSADALVKTADEATDQVRELQDFVKALILTDHWFIARYPVGTRQLPGGHFDIP